MPRTRSNTVESAPKRAKPDGIKVGDKIPAVTLKDQSGVEHSLGEIGGILVIFSYPKASTPGCTKQTRGFNANLEEFTEAGATVFGLSADSEKAQTTFKNKLELGFDLLSDPQYELIEPLGAKKSPKGVVRSHWVFKDGVCTLVEHSVKPDASPVAALEEAQSLSGEGAEGEDEAEDEDEADEPEAESAPGEAKAENGEAEQQEAEVAGSGTEAANEDPKEAAKETDLQDEPQEPTDPSEPSEPKDEPESAAEKESIAEIVKSKVESKLKNPEDSPKVTQGSSEKSDLLAKAAAKVVAEVVTKVSSEGDVNINNVDVSGNGESTKLKEAKEDDRAQQADTGPNAAQTTAQDAGDSEAK